MTPADNSPPPIALRTDSKPARRPRVVLPLAAWVAVNMLAMWLMWVAER